MGFAMMGLAHGGAGPWWGWGGVVVWGPVMDKLWVWLGWERGECLLWGSVGDVVAVLLR